MRKIIGFLTALVVISWLVGFASPASADSITIKAHVEAVAIVDAHAEASANGEVSAYSYVGAQIRSKAKTTKKCMWSTGYNSTSTSWFYDGVPSRICKLKNPKFHLGYKVYWIKVAGGTSGSHCGNFFRPTVGPGTRAVVLDVRAGSTAKIKVSSCVSARVTAKVAVTLSYSYNGENKIVVKVVDATSDWAKACDEAVAKIKVTKHLSLRASGDAITKAKATASAKARAKAQANAEANVKVKAQASVDLEIEIPITPPPTPTPAPMFIQFREFNDLEVKWTSDHCVTVDTPAGHSATVYWTAVYGSFAIPQKTAQDGVQICSLYKAPSEVPNGGTDTITVTATDNVTDKSVTKSTLPFVIQPTAQPPL